MSVTKFITKLETLLDMTAKRAIAQKIRSESDEEIDVATPEPKDGEEEDEAEEVTEQDGDVAGDESSVDTTTGADDAQLNDDIDENPPGVTESDDVEFSVEMFDGEEDEEEVVADELDLDELDEACSDTDVSEEEELEIDPEDDQEEVTEEEDDAVSGDELEDDEEGNLGV